QEYLAYKEIAQGEKAKLEILAHDRKLLIESYLGSIQDDLTVMAHNGAVKGALRGFTEGWNLLQQNQTETLQALYITDNPNPNGEKHKLDAATDQSYYSMVHAKYHPQLRTFLE